MLILFYSSDSHTHRQLLSECAYNIICIVLSANAVRQKEQSSYFAFYNIILHVTINQKTTLFSVN